MGVVKAKEDVAKSDLVAGFKGNGAGDGDPVDKGALSAGKGFDDPAAMLKLDAGVAKREVAALMVVKAA